MKMRGSIQTLRSAILIGRPAAREFTFSEWLSRVGLVTLVCGAASLLEAHPREAGLPGREVPKPRPKKRGAGKQFAASQRSACSKPELLQRQSEFRLPGQKNAVDMLSLLAGSDNCPGTQVPPGTYTAAAPFIDSGTTVGADNTFRYNGCDYSYYGYSTSPGPDHLYTFVITAIGPNPRIEVTANHQHTIYLLNGLAGSRCPPTGANEANNCILTGAFSGNVRLIGPQEFPNVPLNVPLHLVIDSGWYSGPNSAGPYQIKIQDVTIGSAVNAPPVDAPYDLDGDGRSDFPVVRNTGGQYTWYTRTAGDTFLLPANWGVTGDKPVSADFDGDGKYDFAIWRPGPQGRFYFIRSMTQTMQIEDFGQTGDEPVVEDYSGDGADDLAVYRPGATPGAQSYWYYRPISAPSGHFITVPWGQHGDRPSPGHYTQFNNPGYLGPADFVVQRPDGPNGKFYIRRWWGGVEPPLTFGLAGDKLVPGNWDSDGVTDLAVVRPGPDGIFVWEFRSSFTQTIVRNFWGESATDVLAPADYDGDGRMDLCIWRPGSPGTFWRKRTDNGQGSTVNWGQTGDLPAANSRVW
jgi:hypothetical protein